MSGRIRVTGKQRREPDLDKLVFALLRIVKQEVAEEEQEKTPPRKDKGGSSDEESAA